MTERTEREILDELQTRGIARPTPKYLTADDDCPICGTTIPENDHKSLNLGLSSGYCSLGCLIEAEDGDIR